jgi:hypothetical protein
MKRIILVVAFAVALVLATNSKAQAWGAAHVGYTHVGPAGVQHYGRTVAAGPGGVYGGAHYGAYGYGGGSYHAGYGYGAGGAYGGYHAYTPAYGGGYAVGGYHYGGYYGGDVYRAGVYRAY